MEEDFYIKEYAGEIFAMPGEKILSPSGPMSGTVTLRVAASQGAVWPIEILGTNRPELEWMLGKIIRMNAKFVKEQVDTYI